MDGELRKVGPVYLEIEFSSIGNRMTQHLSRGVAGEVHHVDSGYHVVGMKRPDAPDISLAKE
jgi:enoyl-[acyl-carrier-protein] reductase (NADH)